LYLLLISHLRVQPFPQNALRGSRVWKAYIVLNSPAGTTMLHPSSVNEYNFVSMLIIAQLLIVDGSSWCVQGPESSRSGQSTAVVFNGSKKEQFTPTNGFKSLHRKLKTNWKVAVWVDLSV